MKRLTDIISYDDIAEWSPNDVILISAGTGAGKSYFIKNVLYEYAKARGLKILMLVHRHNCHVQFQAELKEAGKTDVVHLKTYQSLEYKVLNQYSIDLRGYAFIVMDEGHYFLEDSSFSSTTEESFDLIMNQANAIKILMSATSENIRKFLHYSKGVKTVDYDVPVDYSNIRSLTFFNKDDSLETLMREAITHKIKTIFFISSVEKAYKLFKQFKKLAIFNCSKSNSKYRFVNENKINEMLVNEKFNELILITTAALDAGVNIVDTDLKRIVVDITDTSSLVQCVGRKRTQDENDKVDLYIKSINNNRLGGIETKTRKKVRMAQYLKSHTVKEFIEKYPRTQDMHNIIYDVSTSEGTHTKKVNELAYSKCLLTIESINKMKKRGDFGYPKTIAEIFGFYDSETGEGRYRIFEDEREKDSVQLFLTQNVNTLLHRDLQKELIDVCNIRDYRNRQQKSIGAIEAYFIENGFPYSVKSKKVKRNKKLVTIWTITEKQTKPEAA